MSHKTYFRSIIKKNRMLSDFYTSNDMKIAVEKRRQIRASNLVQKFGPCKKRRQKNQFFLEDIFLIFAKIQNFDIFQFFFKF